MKQVVQNYRTGELLVDDVPRPALRAGGLLVQTVVSAVSAGTEKSKVDLARKSLVGKAMARPDQVKKVIDTVRKEGVRATYNKVRNKLDALSPLGYSAAGRVVAVGDGCEGFAVGDAVACAGAGFANHAELIWVPENLCAKIPAGVSFEDASFATIGAIALQGIRQAEAQLGETIAVIGLGLIGQLTVQLLRAAGCRVVGVDVDPWKVELARDHGADLALVRTDDVVGKTFALTDGRGADAIIITAAAPDNDPVVLAGDLARDRAHVVIVGAVPLDVPRSPFYEKEIDVRLSRSYGPGRYDRAYEEKGVDYPVGYVRWTENRNMQAFLHALAAKQLQLGTLITHRVPLADATRAYDLVAGEIQERFLGVVLTYSEEQTPPRPIPTPGIVAKPARANVGFIGAGSFAGGTLIPILKAMPQVSLAKVCTASGLSARDTAIRHGFAASCGDPSEILDDDSINVVFVATRHDSHAELAARALARGKTVFVEKPLALTRDQLDGVMRAAEANPALTVGFNRRFSPHTEHVRRMFANCGGALVIDIRVNAGPIPSDSWIHDPAAGGGRLLGEVCHFVDLAHALAGSPIKRVHAAALGLPDPASRLRDNVSITLEHESGSLSTIVYTSKGDMALGKERIEVFGGGISAVIDDFVTTTVVRRGKIDRFKTTQDKGHKEELARFVRMTTSGAPAPIELAALWSSSLATIAATEALDAGAPIAL
jgi:predicted dehydrogenase/threonine dehydrogenase-like Zn-dependent dehydrogenase